MAYSAPVAALAEFEVTSAVNPDDAPELFGASSARKSFQWHYWRTADGEICIAPGWPTEAVQRMDEGWTSLKEYGQFLLQQAGWNVNREPFRVILANGGAKEFSPQQIVSHNWHERPPYKGIKFPQLDLDLVATRKCKFCPRRFSSYSADGIEEAQSTVDANLARHESVIHKENAQNAGLARALKEGLIDPRAAAALPSADLSALVQQLADTQSSILQLLAARESPRDAAYDKLKATTPPAALKR